MHSKSFMLQEIIKNIISDFVIWTACWWHIGAEEVLLERYWNQSWFSSVVSALFNIMWFSAVINIAFVHHHDYITFIKDNFLELLCLWLYIWYYSYLFILFHTINTLRPRKNVCHFANNIFKCIFLNKKVWISILKFHWSLFLRVQLTKFQHWFI